MMTPDIHITINLYNDALVMICGTIAFLAMVWLAAKFTKRSD